MITVKEKFGSGSLTDNYTSPAAELQYIAHADAGEDQAAVLLAVEAVCPGQTNGLWLLNVSLEPMEGNGWWLARCSYGIYEFSFQFDTSGGTKHIVASKQTTQAYGTGAAKTDNGGLIGVTGEGTVEGCDITIPVYNFSETHYIDDSDVTQAYKVAIAKLTGKTNQATFKGFAAGEVLFMGASGSKRSHEDWQITFHFQVSPSFTIANGNALTIGTITNVEKLGWEYMWIRYRQAPVGSLKMLGQVPVAVYCERVYDAGDFSALNIGV